MTHGAKRPGFRWSWRQRPSGLCCRQVSYTCLWCHHKIMFYKITRGAMKKYLVTGISDSVHWASNVCRHDEHDWWYAILDTNFFNRHKTVLVSPWLCCIDKYMLKAYKVAQFWIFLSGWLQETYFLKTKSNNKHLCILKTKCSPSQTLDDEPHNVYILHQKDDGLTEGAYCSCTAGYEIYACFSLFSISCLCSANSGPLR